MQDIFTYEDFLVSQCEIVLLIVDSSYVTIYAKDEHVIDCIHRKAVQNGYENIEYITDENNLRTTLTSF